MPTMLTISHHVPHCNTCSKDKASWSCCQQPHRGLEQENAEAHLARSWYLEGWMVIMCHHLWILNFKFGQWSIQQPMVLPGLRSSLESLQAMELLWSTAAVLEGSKVKDQVCVETEVLFITTCDNFISFQLIRLYKINYIEYIIYIYRLGRLDRLQ